MTLLEKTSSSPSALATSLTVPHSRLSQVARYNATVAAVALPMMAAVIASIRLLP